MVKHRTQRCQKGRGRHGPSEYAPAARQPPFDLTSPPMPPRNHEWVAWRVASGMQTLEVCRQAIPWPFLPFDHSACLPKPVAECRHVINWANAQVPQQENSGKGQENTRRKACPGDGRFPTQAPCGLVLPPAVQACHQLRGNGQPGNGADGHPEKPSRESKHPPQATDQHRARQPTCGECFKAAQLAYKGQRPKQPPAGCGKHCRSHEPNHPILRPGFTLG